MILLEFWAPQKMFVLAQDKKSKNRECPVKIGTVGNRKTYDRPCPGNFNMFSLHSSQAAHKVWSRTPVPAKALSRRVTNEKQTCAKTRFTASNRRGSYCWSELRPGAFGRADFHHIFRPIRARCDGYSRHNKVICITFITHPLYTVGITKALRLSPKLKKEVTIFNTI